MSNVTFHYFYTFVQSPFQINGICIDVYIQENVGGTTYFYPAATGVDSSNTTAESMSVGHSSIGSAYQVYPGTPSHLQGIKPVARTAASGNGSFFVSDDLRMEILHKNALTLLQPDHEQFPG